MIHYIYRDWVGEISFSLGYQNAVINVYAKVNSKKTYNLI